MYIVYILRSQKTLRYYIGQTNNMSDRLIRHNSGRNKSTKKELPWIIIHQESYPTRTEAMRREKQIKSYKGGNAFKELVV